ncbi:hypothetical protein OPV22_030903 [Ensete ventricosum]|uniref:Uncharacterized protein n=1 Tax=Ensete ventricosum TaxID=4639 RepID=A0AAV8PS26_ENSVE|nr:hypothetical protein OPV22_030903 [Ensete ventricosum]
MCCWSTATRGWCGVLIQSRLRRALSVLSPPEAARQSSSDLSTMFSKTGDLSTIISKTPDIVCRSSTGDLDGLHLRLLLRLLLGHRHGQDPVLHGRLHLIHLGILRQPEPPQELVALLLLLLLLLAPLAADLEDPAFLHLLFLHPRQVGLEDVRLGGLLPIYAGVGEGGSLAHEAEGTEGMRKGSQTSREKGSKMMLLRLTIDMVGNGSLRINKL